MPTVDMLPLLALMLYATTIQALPLLSLRGNFNALTASEIDYFTPFTWYASAAHCTAASTLAWNCGGMSSRIETKMS